MLVDWVYEGTYEGTTLLREDAQIVDKILETITEYYDGYKSEVSAKLKKLKE